MACGRVVATERLTGPWVSIEIEARETTRDGTQCVRLETGAMGARARPGTRTASALAVHLPLRLRSASMKCWGTPRQSSSRASAAASSRRCSDPPLQSKSTRCCAVHPKAAGSTGTRVALCRLQQHLQPWAAMGRTALGLPRAATSCHRRDPQAGPLCRTTTAQAGPVRRASRPALTEMPLARWQEMTSRGQSASHYLGRMHRGRLALQCLCLHRRCEVRLETRLTGLILQLTMGFSVNRKNRWTAPPVVPMSGCWPNCCGRARRTLP